MCDIDHARAKGDNRLPDWMLISKSAELTVFRILNRWVLCLLQVELVLWDTAGQEDYDRYLYYKSETDVIVICFSINNPDSLVNVLEKWNPEAKQFCPRIPIILVGNQKDLRDDPKTIRKLKRRNLTPVRKEEGEAMAKTIGAVAYVECSAKNKDGVQKVFEAATRAALRGQRRGNRRCAISWLLQSLANSDVVGTRGQYGGGFKDKPDCHTFFFECLDLCSALDADGHQNGLQHIFVTN